jgi:hypothetical protein
VKLSPLVAILLNRIERAGLPAPELERQVVKGRRWKFDLAYPAALVAAEVDGAVWTQGRHTRGAGFISDCQKLNAANLDGWRVYRFTREMIESGEAVETLRLALETASALADGPTGPLAGQRRARRRGGVQQ